MKKLLYLLLFICFSGCVPIGYYNYDTSYSVSTYKPTYFYPYYQPYYYQTYYYRPTYNRCTPFNQPSHHHNGIIGGRRK